MSLTPEGDTVKRPTIAEIAAQAGVSIGAVSYALNGRPGVSGETRQHILDIANEIGWRPSAAARSLSGSRAHSVGLVIARPADTLGVEPFFMRFIAGLERELSGRRMALLLQVVEDHRAAIEAMRLCWAERRIDGMVVTDLWTEDARIPVLEELGMPAVLVGRPRADTRLPAVWYRRLGGGGLGRRLPGGPRAPPHRPGRRATDAGPHPGPHRGLPRGRVAARPRRAAGRRDRLQREEGARATRALLSRRDRPTAIMFDNDVMALAALNVAQEMGVAVPRDLSIVGGDDSQLCVLVRPALTALSWDIQAYGAHTARVLLDTIDGRIPRLAPGAAARLVVRASTSSPA